MGVGNGSISGLRWKSKLGCVFSLLLTDTICDYSWPYQEVVITSGG